MSTGRVEETLKVVSSSQWELSRIRDLDEDEADDTEEEEEEDEEEEVEDEDTDEEGCGGFGRGVVFLITG